jgi:hypothetical protein
LIGTAKDSQTRPAGSSPAGFSFQNLAVRLARMTIAAVGGTVSGKFFNPLKQENPECKFARRSKT